MPGHPAERFHVEEEIRWRSFNPQLGHAWRRQRIVRRVHLDDGEESRVILEPRLGRPYSFRVEDTGREQRRIGPARGAEANVRPTDAHERGSRWHQTLRS